MSSFVFLLFFKILASAPTQNVAILTPEGKAAAVSVQSLSDKLVSTGKKELQASVILADSFNNLFFLLGCDAPNDACLAQAAALLKFNWLVYARFNEQTLTLWLFDATQGKTVASEEAALGSDDALRTQLRKLFSQAAPTLLVETSNTAATKPPEPVVTTPKEPVKPVLAPVKPQEPLVVPPSQPALVASQPALVASQPTGLASTKPTWKRFVLPVSLLGGSLALGLSTRTVQTQLLNDAQNLAEPGRSAQLRQTGFMLSLGADLLWIGAAFSGWRALRTK